MAASRKLTVCCVAGLSNRITVLVSGLAMAEAAGRDFEMLWPLTPDLNSPFDALFDNDWNVSTVSAEVIQRLSEERGGLHHEALPDLLTADEHELFVSSYTWVVRPADFPEHESVWPRVLELFRELRPTPAIQRRVERFRADHFRPSMIGVHLRRGDFVRVRPDLAGNTRLAFEHIDRHLRSEPAAGIFLCTDDSAPYQHAERPVLVEGVREKFRRRYGDRVVTTSPRSLDRRQPEAIEDALVDLLLLRTTDPFIGTTHSSFSRLASFDRDIQALNCGASTEAWARWERVLKLTGIHQAVEWIGRRRFGHQVPFVTVVERINKKLARMAKNLRS